MNQTGTSLVRQTPFEEFAVKLIEKKSASDLEIARKLQIIKEIISIYCFIKEQFGIKRVPLDLETFEIVRKQICKTALEELEIHKKKWWWLGLKLLDLKLLRIRQWECFLKFGYFDPIKHPYAHCVSYKYLSSVDDLENIFNGGITHPSLDVMPSNLKDLTLTLFAERFGEKNE